MAQCRLQSARLALLAGLLGALLLAPASRALAKPMESRENSLQSQVDSLVAYLRTEANEAISSLEDPEQVRIVQRFEEAHKNRKRVLNTAQRRLTQLAAESVNA